MDLSTSDPVFLLLGGAIFALTAASFGFALLAVLFRIGHDRRARRWDGMTASWEPAILGFLAGEVPASELHALVGPDQGADFLTFLLTFVRRLRGSEGDRVRALAEPYLPAVLARLDAGAEEERANAVLTLAYLGMPNHAPEVAGALDDESPTVAMVAARSLFLPQHEQYFPDVLHHLPRFARWSRSFLSGMLASGGTGAAPLLRAILLDRGHPETVRAVASDALRALNDLQSVTVAAHVLAEETDREVVAGCLRILRQLGQAEHAPLAHRFTRSEDPVVRQAAVAAYGALAGTPAIPELTANLSDPSFWVALEGARALVELGATDIVRDLADSRERWSTLARQVLAE